MSLYTLDLIHNQKEGYKLLEINGIESGVSNFQKVYGDNRVFDKVLNMLREEHGKLSINHGEHTKKTFTNNGEFTTEQLRSYYPNLFPFLRQPTKMPEVLYSKKACTVWASHKVTGNSLREGYKEIPEYRGQPSSVINVVNEELPHTLVNDFHEERVVRNKLFQYTLLKDDFKDILPDTASIGLGTFDEKMLLKIAEKNQSMIIKPITFDSGKGILRLKGSIADKLSRSYSYGKVWEDSKRDNTTIRDLIDEDYFGFEPGIAIIQPFISSDGEGYSSIRSVVCNGEFVDAYVKRARIPISNLDKDAPVEKWEDKNLEALSVEIIKKFQENSLKVDRKNLKKALYTKHLDAIENL